MFWQGDYQKVYLYTMPCDMRKGFDGLFGLVQNQMQLNPLQGGLFVFMSGNRSRIKILHFENDGLSLYYKRLEKGTFKRPITSKKTGSVAISSEDLFLILRGIDIENTKKRRRYLSPNIVD